MCHSQNQAEMQSVCLSEPTVPDITALAVNISKQLHLKSRTKSRLWKCSFPRNRFKHASSYSLVHDVFLSATMMENRRGSKTLSNLHSPSHVMLKLNASESQKSSCMNADRAQGQVWVVSGVWIKILPKWEGDSVSKQLSHTLGSSVGFCAKACKYKSHSRSRSSDYTDPLSPVLQYHQPTPGVMGEI